jgi:hypothetical protein
MARKDIWKKKRNPWIMAGYIAGIIVLAYIAYSVWYFLANQESVEEFQVCSADRCVKTFHIHSNIHFDICGKSINLPLEHGPLEESHTHKERNYVHFHERLPYDPVSGKLLDTTPLQLSTFMNDFDIRFNERCIAGYCNGDVCPDGKLGTIRMFVNEQPNTEFDKYVWKDKDEILITFS